MNTKDSSLGTGQNHVGAESKTICFDVDGTLKDYNEEPRTKVIDALNLYVKAGWRVCVWSGGGLDYARRTGAWLKLPDSVEYVRKGSFRPDIAVDDMEVNLGERNVCVGPRTRW